MQHCSGILPNQFTRQELKSWPEGIFTLGRVPQENAADWVGMHSFSIELAQRPLFAKTDVTGAPRMSFRFWNSGSSFPTGISMVCGRIARAAGRPTVKAMVTSTTSPTFPAVVPDAGH